MRILLALALLAASGVAAAAETVRIAWTHYAGWEPWGYAQQSGILKRWGDKHGVKLEAVLLTDYLDSINQYSAGKFDGCAMTNMDALIGPAAAGVDSTALIVGDYSNGNDGIVLKKGGSVRDLFGRKLMLVTGSVSHYLLARALAQNGMKESDLRLVNTAEGEIAAKFKADPNAAAVTWNPYLAELRAQPGAVTVFDSSKLPGEIMDLLVVRSSLPEPARKALAGAWFEVLGLIKKRDAAALAAMAKSAGVPVAEFERQLKSTALFHDPAKAAAFAESAAARTIMNNVRQFSHKQKLLGSLASPDDIGIAFGDSAVLGDKGKIKLRFTGAAMRGAVP